MIDLNHTVDQLAGRLATLFPTMLIETRKSNGSVPAQGIEMMASAIESVVNAVGEEHWIERCRLENGFATIGEGFSGLTSHVSASYSYIAVELRFAGELTSNLQPFWLQNTSAVRALAGLAEGQDGYLQVETVSENTLRFMLRLPIAIGGSWQQSQMAPPERRTILLVEDEEFVRNVTQEVLEMEGFRVVGVANGAEAIERLLSEQDEVELLLTDVVLPGINGRELAATIADDRPNLKVIFMSGYTDNAVVRNNMSDTGSFYLQKPFTLDTLLAKVHEAFGQHLPLGALTDVPPDVLRLRG
jgi:CheY-like chemotaxis protein